MSMLLLLTERQTQTTKMPVELVFDEKSRSMSMDWVQPVYSECKSLAEGTVSVVVSPLWRSEIIRVVVYSNLGYGVAFPSPESSTYPLTSHTHTNTHTHPHTHARTRTHPHAHTHTSAPKHALEHLLEYISLICCSLALLHSQ